MDVSFTSHKHKWENRTDGRTRGQLTDGRLFHVRETQMEKQSRWKDGKTEGHSNQGTWGVLHRRFFVPPQLTDGYLFHISQTQMEKQNRRKDTRTIDRWTSLSCQRNANGKTEQTERRKDGRTQQSRHLGCFAQELFCPTAIDRWISLSHLTNTNGKTEQREGRTDN
jgi:hypothetical protein